MRKAIEVIALSPMVDILYHVRSIPSKLDGISHANLHIVHHNRFNATEFHPAL
jgi:hypothetical protein